MTYAQGYTDALAAAAMVARVNGEWDVAEAILDLYEPPVPEMPAQEPVNVIVGYLHRGTGAFYNHRPDNEKINEYIVPLYLHPKPDVVKELERLQDKLARIEQWCNAYPLDIFPEPDFAKAHEVLKAAGMTLDAISASNMRHVLRGIAAIAAEGE